MADEKLTFQIKIDAYDVVIMLRDMAADESLSMMARTVAAELALALGDKPLASVTEKDLIERRIPAALKRITDGHGLMRVPAEDTDLDLVLADCRKALIARSGK